MESKINYDSPTHLVLNGESYWPDEYVVEYRRFYSRFKERKTSTLFYIEGDLIQVGESYMRFKKEIVVLPSFYWPQLAFKVKIIEPVYEETDSSFLKELNKTMNTVSKLKCVKENGEEYILEPSTMTVSSDYWDKLQWQFKHPNNPGRYGEWVNKMEHLQESNDRKIGKIILDCLYLCTIPQSKKGKSVGVICLIIFFFSFFFNYKIVIWLALLWVYVMTNIIEELKTYS